MTSPTDHRRSFTFFAVIALVGALVILATVLWDWGHLGYGLGLAALVIGCVGGVVVNVRHRVGRVVAGVVVAVVMVAVGVVAVTGVPGPVPKWADSDEGVLGGLAARTGDLLIDEGTARDVQTGEIVWEMDDSDDAKPSLVSDAIVVIATEDGSVALEPATGRELWRSPIAGEGVAHNGEVLIVSHTSADDQTEAVALDLATGETVWSHPGRPVMECDLGPANRNSPALERSHVLVVPDPEDEFHAELLDLAGGATTIADVDCSITARVLDGVLVEAAGTTLAGRSLADGSQLWTTVVSRPYNLEGGGPTVFTPAGRGDGTPNEVIAIDVATGKTREVTPSEGTLTTLSGLSVRRAPEVWTLLDLDPGAALWNPGTGTVVEIDDATSIEVEGIDVSSGWMALAGRTRDFTGEESKQCWALSQDGTLYGPVPRTATCLVSEGLLETSAGVFPLE